MEQALAWHRKVTAVRMRYALRRNRGEARQPQSELVDREAPRQFVDLRQHRLFDPSVAAFAALGKTIQSLNDHLADLLELDDAEATRRPGRGTEPHAGGDEGARSVEGHRVFVAGDMRSRQGRFGRLA